VLPDERPEALRQRYEPLIAFLSRELDQEVRLIVPEDYGQLVTRFGSGDLDLAYFGGATYVAAAEKHGALPLVIRDIDVEFTSYFLARAERPESAVADFDGMVFAFGSELSTSGHLMPRFFLQEQDIAPETFFGKVRYSGAHDTTVAWVRDGLADLGAVNAEIVEAMLRDGRLAPGVLRIVWETPPYANYVWALRPGLREAYTNRLRDAFLSLSPIDEAAAEILQRMGAGGFLPAAPDEFARLREVMSTLPRFQAMITAGGQ
jgi:phosphonate transport system substrate-binding protein